MTALLEQLKGIVGPAGWTTDPDELHPHLVEWRGAYEGRTQIMLAPATTVEVSAVVSACARAGTEIVPQGGNTGLCGGAIPDLSGDQVVLSLRRMNRIRNLDPENFSMAVDAGCILANVQEAARSVGRYFPLSLSAEGTCQIGGNLSTNAGGINVGRYGTARALVLGLEVVLADGTVLDTMRELRKDTAGYDLKQVFIGSEGTLGIITGAALRLFPDPGELSTAFIGIDSPGAAVALLGRMRVHLDDRIESFELVSQRVLDLVVRHIPGASLPFGDGHPWYVLMDSALRGNTRMLEEALLAEAREGRVLDAVVAKNASEAERFWRLRHSVAEAERQEGKALKHDISVPLSKMQSFLERGDKLLAELRPDLELIAFGHVGDGNLHYNVVLPRHLPDDEWQAEGRRITRALYDLVDEHGGSFSAEHGVGQAKKDWLAVYRGGVELEMMKSLKKTLDPANILNPNKVF